MSRHCAADHRPADGVRVLEELSPHASILPDPAPRDLRQFAVIARPYFVPLIGRETRAWLRKLMAVAEMVRIMERVAACRDRTDDKFLELAINGAADVIVTGDADLLDLNPFRGIPIVTPAIFAEGKRRQSGGNE